MIDLPEIIASPTEWVIELSLPTPSLGAVTKGMSLGRRLVWESEALLFPSLPKLPLTKPLYLCVSCVWVSKKKSSQKTSDLAKVFGGHIQKHICSGNGHTFCRKPARIHPAGLRQRKASSSSSASFPHSSVLCIWPWLNFPCSQSSGRPTWREGCCISACVK